MQYKVTKHRNGVPCFHPFGKGSEAFFIIRADKITTRLARRKRGIFDRIGSKTYFTCPHCGGMNVTHVSPGNGRRDSVMCRKCSRHLFCMYRKEVPSHCSLL